MDIDDMLKPDLILDNLEADTREQALESMARILLSKGYVKESFVPAILDRERKYPSALPMEGHKIAVPHTDAEHVNRSAILFARLARPVEFLSMGAPDETLSVQLISMFALHEKKQIGYMLEVLINAYQDNDTLEAILNAQNAEEIYALLRGAVGAQMTGEKPERDW
ncbi:MAG: PTS sugar transporter subunit IIA [Spirochaetales bacterium]|jgi:PTS system galactitol-specific IIA component|nr:PTS sugar transporter subunit IIA [Spirochaetales bacterium]